MSTSEDTFKSQSYVPAEIKDYVIDLGERMINRSGFTKEAVISRWDDYLKRCGIAAAQFRFSDLPVLVAEFDAEMRQLKADLEAKARGTDQFAGLRAQGWNSSEAEFVERSLAKGERVAKCDKRTVVTTHGRSLDRLALRETFRPAAWTNIPTWNSQFPKIN